MSVDGEKARSIDFRRCRFALGDGKLISGRRYVQMRHRSEQILVTLFRHNSTPNLDNLRHLIGQPATMRPQPRWRMEPFFPRWGPGSSLRLAPFPRFPLQPSRAALSSSAQQRLLLLWSPGPRVKDDQQTKPGGWVIPLLSKTSLSLTLFSILPYDSSFSYSSHTYPTCVFLFFLVVLSTVEGGNSMLPSHL